MIAIETGAAGDALCRRRDRLSGARGYGIRRTLFASAPFGMAPFKAAPVARAGATWARAPGEWIGCHLVLTDPIILGPPDQIWSHKGIVKLHYLRRLHPIGFVLRSRPMCPFFIFARIRSRTSGPTVVLVDEPDGGQLAREHHVGVISELLGAAFEAAPPPHFLQ